MTTHTLGLDIGGANLKAAHSDGTVRAVPFALWKHPEKLTEALTSLCDAMPSHERVAVTMTGELCDCFENKRDGVRTILAAVRYLYEESRILVWSTSGCFLPLQVAMNDPLRVAAANWLALAHFVARRHPHERGILIDTGSTTTDIVYFSRGKPMTRALTDSQRLDSGELVYTGVRRTPICAVVGMEVAAEIFATMLDAYLCVGLIGDDEADRNTADGRPATRSFAHARLARMRCADAHSFSDADARALAERALVVQWNAVEAAIQRVLAGKPSLQLIVMAGSGEVVGQMVCMRHADWRTVPLTSLGIMLGPRLSDAACAYAVAIFAREE